MQNLDIILKDVISYLDHLDSNREEVIRLTRKLNRSSGRGIAKIVRGEEYHKILSEARDFMEKIATIMETLAPSISWRTAGSAVEEYGEFEILHAIVSDLTIPDAVSLKIPRSYWLTALGDVLGELRRIVLNKIIENELADAKAYLQNIQDIYQLIAGLDFSKSLIPNLRHKIDTARAIIERTESDFAHALFSTKTR